jgi:hypothetical protein
MSWLGAFRVLCRFICMQHHFQGYSSSLYYFTNVNLLHEDAEVSMSWVELGGLHNFKVLLLQYLLILLDVDRHYLENRFYTILC